MLSNHSSSEAVLTKILSPASRVSRAYMSRGTLYLMATTFGMSATRAHNSGLIR